MDQKRVIAFVYADQLESLKPIYRACAEGLIANVHEVFGQKPIMVTDDDTEPLRGADVMRVTRKVDLMSWRLLAQCMTHGFADEILFTEPDVRFKENVLDVFDDPEFEVTFTGREQRTTMKDKEVVPITLGCNFSRSGDFWKDCTKYCLKLDHKEQIWGGDMDAFWNVMQSGRYKMKEIDVSIYNHIPLSRDEHSEAKVLHYKGNRKTWLFPEVSEAA